MKRRKFVLIFLLAAVTAMVFSLVSCNKPSENSSVEKSAVISLDKKELILDRYESKLLTATVTVEGAEVVWSTSDDSVASVTDGLVEACGEGKATITATAAGDSATCEVTVADSGLVPSISVSATRLTVPFGETSQIEAKAVYKGVNINAALTYSSNDSKIATVSETGLVTAVGTSLSDNTAVITIKGTYMGYTMSEKKIDVIVTVEAEDKAEYGFNLDMSKETVTATLNENLKDIVTIKDEETKDVVYTSADGQTVTFDKTKLKVGERFFLIEAAGKIYRVPVIVATQIIHNKTEFTAYMELMNERSGPKDDGQQHSFGEYFLLAADIDCAGEVYSRWISWGAFMGVFDGGNHVISNMTLPQDGMFRISRGTIKNFALVNATYTSSGGGAFIANEFYGTIENVFVQGKVTSGASVSGIAGNIRNGAVVKNCVAVVEYVDPTLAVGDKGGIISHFNNTSNSSVINCISVNNVATATVGNMGSGTNTVTDCEHFKTVAALVEALESKGDLLDDCTVATEYLDNFEIKVTSAAGLLAGETLTLQSTTDPFVVWSIVGDAHGASVSGNVLTTDSELAETTTITVRASSIFNSGNCADKVITITAKQIEDKAEYAFNLDMSKETVTATLNAGITGIVTIRDEATKAVVYASAEGQTVTFDKANLTAGERSFLIETADVVYRVPVIVATKIIDNTDDFLVMRAGKESFSGQYFLLGTDLDFKNAEKVRADTTDFAGTLNGNGYAIKNMNIDSEGIFRILSGTVKNLAVIDATFTGAGSIAGWARNNAEINNVYVRAKTTSTGGGCGIANSLRDGTVKIINCVAEYEPVSGELTGTKGGIVNETIADGATITNCFSVSSLATKLIGNEQGKTANITDSEHFTSVAAVKTALESNGGLFDKLTEGNAFWKIVGTTLTFNGITVFDWTE